MRPARPVTRQALRGGAVAVTLAALVSGAVDLPAWAQDFNIELSPPVDPDAPALSPSEQAAVAALAAQLTGATSRAAVVSILQNSTLPKAQVRAAVQAAIADRGALGATQARSEDITLEAQDVTVRVEDLPGVIQKVRQAGDLVKLNRIREEEAVIKVLVERREGLAGQLEQARQQGDADEEAHLQTLIAAVNARLQSALQAVAEILGPAYVVNVRPQLTPQPVADPVAETLKKVLGLIDDSTGGGDTRLTFVDTQAPKTTATAAIGQPGQGSTLAQNSTVTIYVA